MSFLKYMGRLKRMDDLINRRATGTPQEFANKLNISRSMLMVNLSEMKEMGASIKYAHDEQTYYYCEGCRLKYSFELSRDKIDELKGGENIFVNFA